MAYGSVILSEAKDLFYACLGSTPQELIYAVSNFKEKNRPESV